jgi:hypothetical protein
MVAHTCDISYAKSFLLGRKIMVQDQPVQKQDPNWKLTIAKKKKLAGHQWFMSVILATWEAEIWRITV